MTHSSHSGVCHSDMGVMENSWRALPFPTQAGQIGGHEGVGVIEKLGPGVEGGHVKLGDRVGIKVTFYCVKFWNFTDKSVSGSRVHVVLVLHVWRERMLAAW